jgi:hypothetical protein
MSMVDKTAGDIELEKGCRSDSGEKPDVDLQLEILS